MTQIKVYYDSETHEPDQIKLTGVGWEAKFVMFGSSAVLTSANSSGKQLSEAFDHVEQLGFVQAVTMEGDE